MSYKLCWEGEVKDAMRFDKWAPCGDCKVRWTYSPQRDIFLILKIFKLWGRGQCGLGESFWLSPWSWAVHLGRCFLHCSEEPPVPGTWHGGSSWSQEGVLSGSSLGRGWLGRSSLQCEDWFSSMPQMKVKLGVFNFLWQSPDPTWPNPHRQQIEVGGGGTAHSSPTQCVILWWVWVLVCKFICARNITLFCLKWSFFFFFFK